MRLPKKKALNYVQEIHAHDELFAFQNSLINADFSTSTPASSVINTLAGALQGAGDQTGNVATGLAAASLICITMASCYPARSLISFKRFAIRIDLTWTIENRCKYHSYRGFSFQISTYPSHLILD